MTLVLLLRSHPRIRFEIWPAAKLGKPDGPPNHQYLVLGTKYRERPLAYGTRCTGRPLIDAVIVVRSVTLPEKS